MKISTKKLIIICATQRCGSTMVVEDMRNTGVLGVPEEYFIPWDPEKTDVSWLNALEGIVSRASTDNGVTCIKVMADQLSAIDKCIEKDWQGAAPDSTGDFPYFRALTREASYVFLRRDSLVRQAISREMSRQTGVNHATGKKIDNHFAGNLLKGYTKDYNEKVKYRAEHLEGDILSVARENAIWEMYFSGWNISNPLVLRYEEICKNSPSYLSRIAKYCSIELDEGRLPEKRAMVKLSNSRNEEWCRKFTEVAH